MESVQWKVEGMTCANCALTIRQYLEKQGNLNVKVNPMDGDVSFDLASNSNPTQLIKGIQSLGYAVADDGTGITKEVSKPWLHNHLRRFLFCLPFTAILMLHMLHKWIPMHWLMNPWIQLGLCLPVFIVGMDYFGRSAIKSLRNGIPNMNVLVALGATAAFVYSLLGAINGWGADYLFFETTATIITLVFLGNYMEDASVESTQRALKSLAKSQQVMANMIAYDGDHQEHIFPIENTHLKEGDLILVRTGEQVPIDCKILWGEAEVNESIITGESIPVAKVAKDQLIGGSVLASGTVKAQVTATGDQTVLSRILKLVKQAQGEKPPVQQLADKISAVFVPVVIGIAVLTLVANWYFLHDFATALKRSIAVLVIACPCAMGLATPAAIAVGLGRGARNGVLFRNATSLELFKSIRQIVFDKTGTLTTGSFTISAFGMSDPNMHAEDFKRIVYSLEKYSTHPLAKAIAANWKSKPEIRWKTIEEIKGLGMIGTDKEGNIFKAVSFRGAAHVTTNEHHNVYILHNEHLIGWIDLKDELRPEAAQVVQYFKDRGVKTVLLSGDKKEKTEALGSALGIDLVLSEQSPAQKLAQIEALTLEMPTAMVGDGVNDAPALAKATIGISMSEASQLAMQTAQVVLMNQGLKQLPMAMGLGKHTYLTIKQNLFWAFFYNIAAIPIAALGFLQPGLAALAMGLSDVFLAINSGRLFFKKVE